MNKNAMTNTEKTKLFNKAVLTFVQKQWPKAFALIFVLTWIFASVENLAETKTIWFEKYIVIFFSVYLTVLLFAVGKIIPELDAICSTMRVFLDAQFVAYLKMLDNDNSSKAE